VGVSKRAIYLGIGGFYAYLAFFAAGVIFGLRSDDNGVEDFTATVLGWPGGARSWSGRGMGSSSAGSTRSCSRYAAPTGRSSAPAHGDVGAEAAGGRRLVGPRGRGAVYALMGYKVVRAAVTFDPDEAAGLAEGFRASRSSRTAGLCLWRRARRS
jgi:hypothetical protein